MFPWSPKHPSVQKTISDDAASTSSLGRKTGRLTPRGLLNLPLRRRKRSGAAQKLSRCESAIELVSPAPSKDPPRYAQPISIVPGDVMAEDDVKIVDDLTSLLSRLKPRGRAGSWTGDAETVIRDQNKHLRTVAQFILAYSFS